MRCRLSHLYCRVSRVSCLVSLICLTATSSVAAAPVISIVDGKIVLTGLGSSKGLSVVVADGKEDEIAARPAMNGEWADESGKVVFTPKYALKPGTKYRILGAGDRLEVRVPAAERGKPTILTRILPSTEEIPENVLRFYLEFNQPMPRGDVYKHIQILTEDAKPVVQPFLELDDELWNADQTRLTLLIDPGRLKREVKPQIDLGPVFVQGKKYTLVVRGSWPTLDGGTIGKDISKPIVAVARLGDGIEPKNWKLTPPSSERSELTVSFARPMDNVLLQRSLKVIGPNGREVAGTPECIQSDRAWKFRPRATWVPGDYKLHVDPILEDVCGNTIGQPFEVDVRLPAKAAHKPKAIDLPFAVPRHK